MVSNRLSPNPSRRIRRPAPAALLLLLLAAPAAAEGPWRFSAGVVFVDDYPYRESGPPEDPDRYRERLPGTAGVEISARRRLARGLAVEGAAGHLSFARDVPIVCITEPFAPPCYAPSLTARFAPIRLGVRYSLAADTPSVSPYLTASPALYWTRWTLRSPGSESGSSSSTLVPGFSLGLGFESRVADGFGLDFGLRYLRSASPGKAAARVAGADALEGLDAFSFAVSLTWAP